MAAMGVKIRSYKVFAAWAGEKAGRLKLNGHLLWRSPLTDLEETELLRLGVEPHPLADDESAGQFAGQLTRLARLVVTVRSS
jgi:hypothetical protein